VLRSQYSSYKAHKVENVCVGGILYISVIQNVPHLGDLSAK